MYGGTTLRRVPKVRTIYLCRSCGGAQTRWMGKCPDCGAWDSLEGQKEDPGAGKDPQRGIVAAWGELAEGGVSTERPGNPALRLSEVGGGAPEKRLSSGIGEFDRVLGGGLVAGSAILVGGVPGIGKSTLLLQAAASWAARGSTVLYVSSEESAEQIRLRSRRLGLGATSPEEARGDGEGGERFYVLAESNLSRIVEQARRVVPAVVVIDSMQMIYKGELPGAPGSVMQLRRCCTDLVYLAKVSGMSVALVGHVTKDGVLAGPRLLEHLVDAVLYFEGDRYHSHRVVRAVKNRFGATLEIGLFEMTGQGLREAAEGPGAAAVTLQEQPRPGSVVCPVVTGTRCVLVEVQALTATGFLGAAKRKSSGVEANRLAMLIAVLEQHGGLRMADRDIFASSVGGMRVVEPAADLALLLAIAGAHYRRALGPATAVVGEVGLGGEVRPVPHLDQRINEAARLGFRRIVIPAGAVVERGEGGRGVEVVRVGTVDQAIAELG